MYCGCGWHVRQTPYLPPLHPYPCRAALRKPVPHLDWCAGANLDVSVCLCAGANPDVSVRLCAGASLASMLASASPTSMLGSACAPVRSDLINQQPLMIHTLSRAIQDVSIDLIDNVRALREPSTRVARTLAGSSTPQAHHHPRACQTQTVAPCRAPPSHLIPMQSNPTPIPPPPFPDLPAPLSSLA